MNLEFIRPFIKYIPEVRNPRRHVPFKEKLMWVGIVLLSFFIMGVIFPAGVSPQDIPEVFQIYQVIFASQMGSIISIGIGPIVTASIILQLMVGSKMIDLDLNDPNDQSLFQATQKILTIFIALFEAAAIGLRFGLGSTLLGDAWSVFHPLVWFIILQIALGSIILMFLDEVVSKWGVGSGVGLFIAGGVSQQIMTATISFQTRSGGGFVGSLPRTFNQLLINNQISFLEIFNSQFLFPVIAVIVTFLVVVLGQSMRLEIPLSYGGVRGVGGRYPLQFFYVSNIPVILAAALLANVRMWAQLAGVDVSNPPTDLGIIQQIVYHGAKNMSLGELSGVLAPDNLYMLMDPGIIIHLIIYSIAFTGLCVLFGKFWVETTGLSADSIAEQIQQGGMQIPGFRRDQRVIERVLNRYIPQITIISSVAVGLLAVGADLMGAHGSGTGILLTVGILYQLYEQIQQEQMAEMHPAFRKFMGKG